MNTADGLLSIGWLLIQIALIGIVLQILFKIVSKIKQQNSKEPISQLEASVD